MYLLIVADLLVLACEICVEIGAVVLQVLTFLLQHCIFCGVERILVSNIANKCFISCLFNSLVTNCLMIFRFY